MDQNYSIQTSVNGETPEGLACEIYFGVVKGSPTVRVYHHEDLSMSQKFKISAFLKKHNHETTYQKVDKTDFNSLISQEDDEVNEEFESTDAEKFFDNLFELAVAEDASDIHLFVYPDDPHVLIRVNGELERVKFDHKLSAAKLMRVCRAIYASMCGDTGSNKNSYMPSKTQSATIQERRAKNGHAYRLRYQDAELDGSPNSIHVALRILDIDRDFTVNDLVGLGYEPDQQQYIFDGMLKGAGGLIIIVGATGDGKTTTAATVLGHYAKESQGRKMILTAEDPVEFNIPGVRHVQVAPIDGETESEAWERHLAAKMRMDPDFIFQGETRTVTTAASACHAALTGHTTMVTLHGNSAFDALSRLEELKVPRSLMASDGFIKGIVFQRLVPILCPHCSLKFADYPGDQVKQLVERGIASRPLINRLIISFNSFAENVRFRNIEGCDHCRKGYIAREAVAEPVIFDSYIREKIAQGDYQGAQASWKNQGSVPAVLDEEKTYGEQVKQHCVGFTAFDHGIKKMLEGRVSPVDIEDKLDLLAKAQVDMDHSLDADEVGRLTGLVEAEIHAQSQIVQ